MPDMKGAHTTQRSVPTKLTKKMTDETIVWAQKLQRGIFEEEISWNTTQTKKEPIILMNLCTSCGPFWGGKSSPPVFFHRSAWCKILRYWLATKVALARTQSRVQVYVKTQRCHWKTSAGTENAMDIGLSSQLDVSDTNVFNTKTQANVAGYDWFSMLLQYHMNILTT